MSRKASGFWYHIRLLVKSVPLKAYHRILGLILLALLTLITTLCIPTLATQRVEGSSEALTQTSNAHSLLQQGIELYEAEQFSEAIEVWQQATSAFLSQGDTLNQALVLRYLSLAHQHLGQWEEAQRAIASSLELLDNQRNTANTQNYLDVFAKALNTQGRLQATKGQWSDALSTWKKAAVTYKKAGNETGVIGSLINQAQALQALGLSSQAEAELLHVEQILLQQPDPELATIGLQNLGEALRRVGNLSKSQEVLQKSLAVAKEFQLSRAQSSALLELGNTERALANRAIAIGKQDDEKQHIQAAIASYQQAADSPTLRVQAQLNLLSLLVESGKPSEAEKLVSVIQPSLLNLPPSRTNIYAQLNFAQSLTKLGIGKKLEVEQSSLTRQYPASSIAQILATAVQQARSLKDRVAESYAIGQLGGLYELTEQLSAAYDLTQQALLLAEEMQAPEIRYRWEWQMGHLWEKQGDIKKAIAAYEEAVATLKSVRSDLLTIISEVQFSFRDNVEPVHRKLVDLLLRTETDTEPNQENLRRAIEVIDSLQLAELENFLSCNLSQTVQLNQEIDKIDPESALIYPIILEDRLEVIFKFPGQPLKHYVTLVKQTEVEKTAIELRRNILKRNYPEVVIEKATQLYDWLIKPLEKDLEKSYEVKTLVFVLDGVLRNIPMSVLYDYKSQEYLMQKPYALALVPGLQLFDLRPREQERLEVLTAGVSEQREVEQRRFDELPNVVEELQQIGSVVPSESLLNPEFTEANLQEQINSGAFSTVHIATHGKFSSDPEETFILAYDQLLNSNDLNNLLRSNNQKSSSIVELLVLSACETAQGDNRATLGLAGIAVRAGARSTLATLWQVSDRSTAELMEQFYKKLTNPELTKSQALHQAQLELFKQYKAPYYWAPFVLVGNWL
ncbi:MAG: CHAT domain-containing protein [Symplocastrum torsivum CPER-KK1]|jgi:CHAT domain-containing protein|uniref:CHAT domain-containing protein n=1 Tax=Symplocastrum torsivum CPER-KK1 TaxID=450513 RepID=A0A951PRQ0_9CYAN|nr:CHAT domain-containing protein [Symplocastrum torsivum CPER-KK1]